MTVLEVCGLSVARGERLIVADINLRLEAGDGVQLTGPNGVGKTTLLKAIAGLIAPQGGSVRLPGPNDADGNACDDAPRGERIHFVGHSGGLKAAMTVFENARFWARYYGAHDKARPDDGGASADIARSAGAAGSFCSARGNAPLPRDRLWQVLERFGLQALADIPADYLSAGQQRRLSLTRLVLTERPLWLLDEPTVGLDSASRALLDEVIAAHLARGGAVLAATHQPLGTSLSRRLELAPPPASAQRAQSDYAFADIAATGAGS